MRSSRATSSRTTKWKIFVNNIFNTLYYDAFYQSAAPFVLVAPGRVDRRAMITREVLELF